MPNMLDEKYTTFSTPFIYWYEDPHNQEPRIITRAEFSEQVLKAAGVLRRFGLKPGERFVNGFGRNDPADMVFRRAAALTGTTPVTINWQADTPERATWKASVTDAKLLLKDETVSPGTVKAIKERCPEIPVYETGKLGSEPLPAECESGANDSGSPDDEKMIIFTSGTTGDPKGVVLTRGNYETNAATFSDFFETPRSEPIHLVMVNSLHHANSSAMFDWLFTESDAVIHLLPKYTTPYWRILAEAAENAPGLVIAPGVSRHFDFLEELAAKGKLPIDEQRLREALSRVTFLLGSAPVGPTTVERLMRWTGRPPLVRFGSTETCLQVMGTPSSMDADQVMGSFRAGWERRPSPGYFIGRPHSPHTRVDVVKSVNPSGDDYLEFCGPGEEGKLVAGGGNVMREYLCAPEATGDVLRDGWYLGFGDVGFYLVNPGDGQRDFYWLGRESALVIKGGANYACDQIAAELERFVVERYGLKQGSFDLAVVGVRLESEHEDTCCVTLDVSGMGDEMAREIEATFLEEAAGAVSKGAKPQRLRFGPVPRNFKGAVKIGELKKTWLEE
ncbi:MAG: AMP-binding protein [Synergistota bacterium]|nr:AMP-binding protein [Synergistota bacterium]